MSGDVAARASRFASGVDSGQWDVVREQGEFYGVYVGEFGRRVAGLIYDRREAEFIAAARTLVPELVDEIERKSAQLAEWIAQYQDREAEVEKLRGALSSLVDPDDCWFDHNGDCQAHGFFDGQCGHAVAKELLAGVES